MDEHTLEILIRITVGLLSAMGTFGIFMAKKLFDSIRDLSNKHHALELDVTKNYATKSDLNEARRENTDSLKRVYDKIEDVEENMTTQIAVVQTDIKKLLERV